MRNTVFAVDVERIPIVARRMALRNVERIEVVIDGFNLRPALDSEPEIEEDFFNFALHLRDGMQRAERAAVAGEGEVGNLSGPKEAALSLVVPFELVDRRCSRLD